jgi:rubrerythrin
LRPDFEASASVFDGMADEERGHRDTLYDLYRQRFGEHLPPIRREDVRGFLKRRPVWWSPNLDLDKMRGEAAVMEQQAASFYERAAGQTTDLTVRRLFTDLAEIERGHERRAEEIAQAHMTADAEAAEERAAQRLFVLQYVQPGLAGLIDGSVSTLAPLFAAAFATRDNWETFLVGLAASIGAGISMGFTEALSDNGEITGRGSPWLRGLVCGLMTAVGGVGHTLPYLVPNSWPNAFLTATSIAAVVVAVELLAISWIRTKYMESPFWSATLQVVLGGVLVLLAGILIGSA